MLTPNSQYILPNTPLPLATICPLHTFTLKHNYPNIKRVTLGHLSFFLWHKHTCVCTQAYAAQTVQLPSSGKISRISNLKTHKKAQGFSLPFTKEICDIKHWSAVSLGSGFLYSCCVGRGVTKMPASILMFPWHCHGSPSLGACNGINAFSGKVLQGLPDKDSRNNDLWKFSWSSKERLFRFPIKTKS